MTHLLAVDVPLVGGCRQGGRSDADYLGGVSNAKTLAVCYDLWLSSRSDWRCAKMGVSEIEGEREVKWNGQ